MDFSHQHLIQCARVTDMFSHFLSYLFSCSSQTENNASPEGSQFTFKKISLNLRFPKMESANQPLYIVKNNETQWRGRLIILNSKVQITSLAAYMAYES